VHRRGSAQVRSSSVYFESFSRLARFSEADHLRLPKSRYDEERANRGHDGVADLKYMCGHESKSGTGARYGKRQVPAHAEQMALFPKVPAPEPAASTSQT
jgi:hypothetical protein